MSLVEASVEDMGCWAGVERGAVRGWGIVKRSSPMVELTLIFDIVMKYRYIVILNN